MGTNGYGIGWTVLMSLLAFAGSAQYVAITFLTTIFNPVHALLMTLMVNARHLFYGVSMLSKFKGTGKFKPYLIFGLCDETFSILCTTEPPEGINRNWFIFFITVLNHGYWILGSATGAALTSIISFNAKGLDFVLTALFVVIFIDQWKSQKNHKPAMIGVLCTVVCLIVFGDDKFIIPSMIAILSILTVTREVNSKHNEQAKEGADDANVISVSRLEE